MKFFFIIIIILIIILSLTFLYLYKTFYYVWSSWVWNNDSLLLKIKKLDKWLTKLHSENKFNGWVLLIKDWKEIINNTYWYTDFTQSKKLDSDSSFRLASVSKQFTAMWIMLLKEQWKLDFDDLVSDYIPWFKYSEITIRHLLNHTSWIPDVYFKLAQKHKDELVWPLSIKKAIELFINSNTKLKKWVNEKFMYSNTNYIILAWIVENISEVSFEEFMKQNLFDKAWMNNSRFWNLLSKDKNFDNQTHSFYFSWNKTFELAPDFIDWVAWDWAIFSSLNDLILWDKLLYSNQFVSQESLTQAFTNPILKNWNKSPYWFWWMVEWDVVRHNWGWLWAKSILIRNTKEKSMLVIITNSWNWQVFWILNEFKKNFWKQINIF